MSPRLNRLLGIPLSGLLDLGTRLSSRRIGLVVVYHRVGDRRAADPVLPSLPRPLFERQLAHLRRRFRVVAARELLSAVAARKRGERIPVAVTFDDDLESHVRVVMPALRRLGLPATFFLTGATLSQPATFWWERLEAAVDRGALDEDELRSWLTRAEQPERTGGASSSLSVREAAAVIVAMPAREREQVADRLRERVGDGALEPGLRQADVRELARAGFEIGFHTRRHEPLPGLDAEALRLALDDGRQELEAAVGAPTELIAYPHGLADAAVAACARAAGYRFGFTVSSAPVGAEDDLLLIPRAAARQASLGQFALALSSLLRAEPQPSNEA